MTLMLWKPHPETIRAFLDAQAMLAFTYPAVGATASQPPRRLQMSFAEDSVPAIPRVVSP